MAENTSGNTMLRWLFDMASLLSTDPIKIPGEYRERVLAVKSLMHNDETGIVSSMLDFAISSATDVDYRIETSNANLTEMLNNWANNINSELRGKIPIGLDSLAKEYFRERWKGSSNLLLRTVWETVDGYYVPTKLWFVDGEDIVIEDDSESVRIGEEKYFIRISKEKKKRLPASKDEMIFAQKPYESWGSITTVPYIIQKGLYKNAHFMMLLIQKGQTVVSKALEYIMMLKKGTEKLALEGRPEFVYDETDLKKVKDNFTEMIGKSKGQSGVPAYTTNFDTELEHIIPDYDKILNGKLYEPLEKRLLNGIGLVDIVEGTTSTRREAILNPKPFIGEVNSGVIDFVKMFEDVLTTIIEKNKNKHKKYFGDGKFIAVHYSPVKVFVDDKIRQLFRSMYDRGILSKRTFAEVVGGFDYDLEVQRRVTERQAGDGKRMYPPVIQNLDEYADWDSAPEGTIPSDPDAIVLDDRNGPEAKNFKSAALEDAHCPACGAIFDFEAQQESGIGKARCPDCSREVSRKELLDNAKDYEEAPYKKTSELPDGVKNSMSVSLQKVWMKAFNSAYDTNGEEYAIKVAWSVIKKIAKKGKDGKWHRKAKQTKASLEKAHIDAIQEIELGMHKAYANTSPLDDLIKIKKLELLEKKQELLDKLSKENQA